jgi:hypothetical protein
MFNSGLIDILALIAYELAIHSEAEPEEPSPETKMGEDITCPQCNSKNQSDALHCGNCDHSFYH